LSSKKHPLGEKRNHPGSKLRQGFWMVFRFGVNNWGYSGLILFENQIQTTSVSPCRTQVQPAANFLVCTLIFIEYESGIEHC
ncbi:hypothetical protein RLF33_00390, partial [Streptococcus pneumoniae]|nr:hypothetical protein [Streptococcus pneumoniae]